MSSFQDFFNTQCSNIQSNAYYKKIQAMPPTLCWLLLAGFFIVFQLLVFGFLYLAFGKMAMIGLFASILSGLATGVGAMPAIFLKDISERLFNTLLGGAAGIMLAATAFSLLIPGMEFGNEIWPGNGLWAVAIGMLLGAGFIHIADQNLPHLHAGSVPGVNKDSLQRIWLFIIAITIHNFPEGMSVGVSFGSGDMKNGIVLAIAVAMQNVPEGLAVALPLIGLGYDKWKAVGIATLTGLVEPIGSILGITMVTVFSSFLPVAMGFAAGAMLFVITEEIIPETHAKGRSRHATFSLMIGFIIMMALDTLLA